MQNHHGLQKKENTHTDTVRSLGELLSQRPSDRWQERTRYSGEINNRDRRCAVSIDPSFRSLPVAPSLNTQVSTLSHHTVGLERETPCSAPGPQGQDCLQLRHSTT